MQRIDVVVIGAGQAGLAISRCLRDRAIQHVVFEQGRIAERWRNASWDSLKLLTPNWMTRLPGYRYAGSDRDGFMSKDQLIRLLTDYAFASFAPVETGTAVRAVTMHGNGYRVSTSRGEWLARAVVIATGHCQKPLIPALAHRIPTGVTQIAAPDYRNPADLPEGDVLIIGASATGVQLADEIRRAGHSVTLSVGRHTRLPRRYRGRDIMWWMDRIGVLNESADSVTDIEWARRQPSLQLVGGERDMGLAALRERGVELAGRAVAAVGGAMHFADDLSNTVASAGRTLARLLVRIDDFIRINRLGNEAGCVEPMAIDSHARGRREIAFGPRGIRTVIWATGFLRSYPWLQVPVLDRGGEVMHRNGVTPAPGLYAIGLRFLRTRKSSFIDGVGDDANAIADHLAQFMRRSGRMAA